MNLVFFGSFQHYSALVLKALIDDPDLTVTAVVTTSPSQLGRKKILTKNPVHHLAAKHHLPVITPSKLGTPTSDLRTPISGPRTPSSQPPAPKKNPPDFFVVAGYAKILPKSYLEYPQSGCLNLHFSLLPKFRGANPAEWAILLGESVTGISLIQMDTGIDTGPVIAKESLPISPKDTRETLYQKLYLLGADHLPAWLKRYFNWQQKKDFYCQQSLAPEPQPHDSPTPTAFRFTRTDGFIDWAIIRAAMQGKSFDAKLLKGHLKTASEYLKLNRSAFGLDHLSFIKRASRALKGYPSLWTLVPTPKGPKRLKILKTHVISHPLHLELIDVQLEGLQPTAYNQIKNQITHL